MEKDEAKFSFQQYAGAAAEARENIVKDYMLRKLFFYPDKGLNFVADFAVGKPPSFSAALNRWVVLYSQITRKDTERLRRSLRVHHYWDVLLLDYVLFDRFPYTFSSMSPRAGIFPILLRKKNGEQELYLTDVFRNTTLRTVKVSRSNVREAAKLLRKDATVKIRTKVVDLKNRVRIGPLPKSKTYEVIVHFWPKVMRVQEEIFGLPDFRPSRIPVRWQDV